MFAPKANGAHFSRYRSSAFPKVHVEGKEIIKHAAFGKELKQEKEVITFTWGAMSGKGLAPSGLTQSSVSEASLCIS